jgi:hypothetical protein
MASPQPAAGTATSPARNALGDPGKVDAEIRACVADLTSSLSALFAALPAGSRRAPGLVKELGIDNPLACRLLRVANAADPAEAVEFLPTVNQIKRAVERAGTKAPAPIADAARTAVVRFDELVTELGIDQRGFESLVSALSPGGVRRVEMQHRRAAFRANAHLWGSSAEYVSTTMILVPNEQGRHLDLHAVRGYVNMRITRPNATVVFGSRMRGPLRNADGTISNDAASISDACLMTDFSTIQNVSLIENGAITGFRGTRVEFKGLRPSDAETMFIRRFVPNFVPTNTNEYAASNTLCSWPAAMFQVDIAIPSGLSDPGSMVAEAYARREDPKGVFDLEPDERVPQFDVPKAVTNVTALPPTRECPQLAEIFASIVAPFLKRGLRFDVYRLQVPFPMLHSLQCLKVRHVPTERLALSAE